MLAFISIKTTGLDPELHEIWEVAFILESAVSGVEKMELFQLPLDLENADVTELEIGGFYERHPLGGQTVCYVEKEHHARRLLLQNLSDAILVGNNPAFDAAFLQRFIGSAPWHYHVVDVKALVAGRLGLSPPWTTGQLERLAGLRPRVSPHNAMDGAERVQALYKYALGLQPSPDELNNEELYNRENLNA